MALEFSDVAHMATPRGMLCNLEVTSAYGALCQGSFGWIHEAYICASSARWIQHLTDLAQANMHLVLLVTSAQEGRHEPWHAFQAAVSALAGGPGAAIFSDELNHASIIDGARLAKAAGARLFVYRHNDLQHLASLLDKAPQGMRKLVVTDSLFSMDGELACLPDLN